MHLREELSHDPQDVPRHAENILQAVDAKSRTEFIQILEIRLEDLSAAQAARLKKLIRGVEVDQ